MVKLSSGVNLALNLYEVICHVSGGRLEGSLQIDHILLCVLDSDDNIVGLRGKVNLAEYLTNSHIHLFDTHISLVE